MLDVRRLRVLCAVADHPTLSAAADALSYASLGELRSPEARAEQALELRDLGFRALKLRAARDRLDEGVACVAAVREAVGDTMEILVDLNQWWRMPGDVAPGLGPQAARRVVERLAEHAVPWVEEPLPGSDLEGMRTLRGQAGAPIAGGEMARNFDELLVAHEHDALYVFQPDVVLALGMSRARHAGRAAAAPQPPLHAAHVDQRPRPARQPARGLGGRRTPGHGVPVRPAGLDRPAPRLHAGRAGRHRRRRLPTRPECRRLPALVRRGSRQALRRDRADRPRRARARRARATRRDRRRGAVELPADHHGVETRARAGDRQQRGAQARRAVAAVGARARRAGRRGRAPRRRAQRCAPSAAQ